MRRFLGLLVLGLIFIKPCLTANYVILPNDLAFADELAK